MNQGWLAITNHRHDAPHTTSMLLDRFIEAIWNAGKFQDAFPACKVRTISKANSGIAIA